MIIQYWHSQRCIGYQQEDGIVRSVMQGHIEREDGTLKTVWYCRWRQQPGNYVCTTALFDTCPRIDIPPDSRMIVY